MFNGDSMIDFFQTINVKRFIFADGDNVNNPKVFIDFLNEQKYLELNSQIISVVEHFCSLGVQIKRIPICHVAEKDNEKSSEIKNTNAELNLELIKELSNKILQINNKKRPQKIATLKNVLKNLDRKNVTDKNVDNVTNQIIKKLEKEKKLSVKNQKLEWK